MQRNLLLFCAVVFLFFSPTMRAQYSYGPKVNSLTCATKYITGSATDNCTVTLSYAAGSTGKTVYLTSSNSAVAVPYSITVRAYYTSATFAATVSSVSSTQMATISARTGWSSQNVTLQLNASTSSSSSTTTGAKLSVNSTSIPFGNLTLNSTATQSLIISSTGSSALTISGVAITGSGFSMSGVTPPLTLNPGQSATLNVAFHPTVTGSVTGQVTITSNSSTGSQTSISLSGAGQTVAHQVNLTWYAPTSSSDPVAGYRVFRAPSGSSTYQQVNASAVTQTSFVDTTVQSGQTYSYMVKSVDASGNLSVPSNTASMSVP